MVRLLKYCLSIVFIFVLGSCKSDQEKIDAAREFADHTYQGTPSSMNAYAFIKELDSTDAEVWRELSIPYLKRGMPHKWKPLMDKAVALNPSVWQPYRGYNYLWFYRDYKKAIADFDASDTLTPNFTDAPQGHSVDYWRGIAYLGLDDYDKSISYFNTYLSQVTEETGEDWAEPTAFLYRGIANYKKGNFEDAEKDFDKLLLYNRDHSADGKYYKALLLKEKMDCLSAQKFLEEAEEDFKNGYYNNRDYVETLYQIYPQDFEKLKLDLETQCQHKKEHY